MRKLQSEILAKIDPTQLCRSQVVCFHYRQSISVRASVYVLLESLGQFSRMHHATLFCLRGQQHLCEEK